MANERYQHNGHKWQTGGLTLIRFGGGTFNVFTIWCRIMISRPLRVFRRFKHRSCSRMHLICRYPQYIFRLVNHKISDANPLQDMSHTPLSPAANRPGMWNSLLHSKTYASDLLPGHMTLPWFVFDIYGHWYMLCWYHVLHSICQWPIKSLDFNRILILNLLTRWFQNRCAFNEHLLKLSWWWASLIVIVNGSWWTGCHKTLYLLVLYIFYLT